MTLPKYVTDPWLAGASPISPLTGASELWRRCATKYDCVVREEGFSRTARPSLDALSFRCRDLLLASGILTTPARTASDMRAWGFFIESLSNFRRSNGRIRVSSDARDWDSTYQGHFSFRIGMGLAGLLLWRHYNVVHIADAEPFIGAAISRSTGPFRGSALSSRGLYGADGKYKPDFFCLTADRKVVIAEAKGGFGPPSTLKTDKAKAVDQARNVEPIGLKLRTTENRLVFATNLRREDETVREKGESSVSVVDATESTPVLSVPVTETALLRNAYAKILAFSGLAFLAHQVREGGPRLFSQNVLSQLTVKLRWLPVVPLANIGTWLIGLHADVAEAIFGSNSDEEFLNAVLRAGEQMRGVVRESENEITDNWLVLPNGLVASRWLRD